MPLVDNALHDGGSMLGKVCGAEESGLNLVMLQRIQDEIGAGRGDLNASFKIDVHALLSGQVKLLGVKTQ